jgi:hypothetical protein
MIACKGTGNIVEYHFADASKPIVGGKGAIQRLFFSQGHSRD